MAPALQHNPSAFFARLSTTGAGGHHTRCQPAYSAAAAAKLTLRMIPLVGVGQLLYVVRAAAGCFRT
jgi:hypothetical protein